MVAIIELEITNILQTILIQKSMHEKVVVWNYIA